MRHQQATRPRPVAHGTSRQHGLSLQLAAELDWESALVLLDEREDDGELRMIALAPRAAILYCVAFVDRGQSRRVNSLWRANRREVKHYVQSSEKTQIEMPSLQEDRKITAQAKADPQAQPLTPAQLKAMVPLESIRGRPKSDNKKLLLSVRYSP